jgi:hypothetical protein
LSFFRADKDRMMRDREQRAETEDVPTRGAGRGAGKRNRNRASRLPFEQEELDREEHSRDRSREGGGHPRGRSRNQECLSLSRSRVENLPMTEPKAPPVMMIGPSARKGPPDPIEIAAEIGLRTASLGCTLLPLIRIDSSASGMPWPRIGSDPCRAMSPIIRPPATGISNAPIRGECASGDTNTALKRP